jgi:hypothetical protein
MYPDAVVESEVVLNIGAKGSLDLSGEEGFDLDFPTLNRSKKVGAAARADFLGVEVRDAKSDGRGLECAGGRK